MTSHEAPRRSGGRRTAAAAVSILAVLGAVLLVFALAGQVGAPPEPALRTGGAVSDGGGTERSKGGGSERPDGGDAEQRSDPATDVTEPMEQPATPAPADRVAE